MISRFWTLFRKNASTITVAVLIFLQPLFAFAADEPEKAPEWVLPYFLVLLFVGLSIVVLLRTANRSDSTFSQEELDKIREEEMKKMTGSHT